MPDGTPIQRGDRPTGNLLLIPTRFAIKMQDDGWYLRMLLPVKIKGHPESVEDRTTHDYEWVLVFTKQRQYFWNKDAIREPLAEGARPQKRGKYKAGVIRRDKARDVRVAPNPNGRNPHRYWNSPLPIIAESTPPPYRRTSRTGYCQRRATTTRTSAIPSGARRHSP